VECGNLKDRQDTKIKIPFFCVYILSIACRAYFTGKEVCVM